MTAKQNSWTYEYEKRAKTVTVKNLQKWMKNTLFGYRLGYKQKKGYAYNHHEWMKN